MKFANRQILFNPCECFYYIHTHINVVKKGMFCLFVLAFHKEDSKRNQNIALICHQGVHYLVATLQKRVLITYKTQYKYTHYIYSNDKHGKKLHNRRETKLLHLNRALFVRPLHFVLVLARQSTFANRSREQHESQQLLHSEVHT